MFRIPSECKIKSSEMKYSSSDKYPQKKANETRFTHSVSPSNFGGFDSSNYASIDSSTISSSYKSEKPLRAIPNIPIFKKSEVITQCPAGYSSIGGLNVGSQYLNCVHDITRKQIQIMCPPNYSLDANGKCTLNKNKKPNLAPKNAKPSNFPQEDLEREYDVPKIYKDFPKNAHNSFRSSKKIILSDEQ
jgi:hypothetical protein